MRTAASALTRRALLFPFGSLLSRRAPAAFRGARRTAARAVQTGKVRIARRRHAERRFQDIPDCFPDAARGGAFRGRRRDRAHTVGMGSRYFAEPFIHALMEFRARKLKTVCAQTARRTAQPQGSGVHRQKHRTVGQDPLTGELVCLPHEIRVKPATVALVRHRRVHETVAENHRPARKRRTNDLRHDLRACSLVQIELRAVVEHVVLRVKHDCAQVFSHFRAARLAQAHHVQARLFQNALHKRDLRGLAHAFAAFERDEHAR